MCIWEFYTTGTLNIYIKVSVVLRFLSIFFENIFFTLSVASEIMFLVKEIQLSEFNNSFLRSLCDNFKIFNQVLKIVNIFEDRALAILFSSTHVQMQ